MPLIVTPGQLSRRSELYYQLSQYVAAGLGLIQAIQQLERKPPSRSFRKPLQRLLNELAQGFPFSEALQRIGNWLPDFDIALLDAGERTGRLDASFRALADYYNDRASMARQMVVELAYPVALAHFAVFILPFAKFFTTGDWRTYLFQTVGILLPLYVGIALIIYAAQSKHGEIWRGVFERLTHPIPLLGSGRRSLALSRLAMALEALISAGVTIIEAWDLAASVSGSVVLRRAVQRWRPEVVAGQTPAEALSASGKFPELFVGQYTSGEVSGKLDEALGRLHRYYQEEGTRKLHALAQWTPRIFFLLVALAIAYKVITFYAGYFNQLKTIMDGF